MPSFWDRLKQSLAKARFELLGGPPPEELPTEEEEPTEYPEEYEPEPEPYSPEELQPPPEGEPTEEDDCIQGYFEGYARGRNIRVKSRWYVSNPNIECIRRLISTVGDRNYYTLIVCGSPEQDYQGKEGEESICLGYVRSYGAVTYYSQSSSDAVDFANNINSVDPATARKMVGWTSVESISILDVPDRTGPTRMGRPLI